MEKAVYNSTNQVLDEYGREHLIAIDNLRQIIFYTRNGYQPLFVFENERKEGRLTAWFDRIDTKAIYQKWIEHTKNNG